MLFNCRRINPTNRGRIFFCKCAFDLPLIVLWCGKIMLPFFLNIVRAFPCPKTSLLPHSSHSGMWWMLSQQQLLCSLSAPPPTKSPHPQYGAPMMPHAPPLPLILFLDACLRNCVSSPLTIEKGSVVFKLSFEITLVPSFQLHLQKLPQIPSFWTQGATGVPRNHQLVKLLHNFSFLKYFHFDPHHWAIC